MERKGIEWLLTSSFLSLACSPLSLSLLFLFGDGTEPCFFGEGEPDAAFGFDLVSRYFGIS